MSPISSRNSVPPAAASNFPIFAGDRSGKGPLLVAEELALEKLRGDRRGVHGDEGPARPLAVVMNGPGDQFLARAALAVDQDRGVAFGHPADRLVDLLHGRRIAHQPALVLLPHLGSERVHFERKPPDLDGLAYQDVDLVEIEGLGDIVEGPAAHGFDRVLHGGLRGHDDDRHAAVLRLDLLERLEPAHARHADVHQRERDAAFLDPLKRFGSALRRPRSRCLPSRGTF